MTVIVSEAPLATPAPLRGTDESQFEIIGGEQVEAPNMSAFASLIATSLVGHLFVYTKDRGHVAMETLFRLALPVARNRRPDIAYVSYDRWPKARPYNRDENAWDVVPNLAVEVISPHDHAEELMEKVGEYFRAGVQLVWIIFPREALVYVYESLTQVHGLGRSDVLDGGTVLPGFRLPLAELFPAA